MTKLAKLTDIEPVLTKAYARPIANNDDGLKNNPFFKHFENADLMSTDIAAASKAAKIEHPHLLSYDIPSLSFAAGGTKILKKSVLDDDHKVDMNTAFKRDGWPTAHVDKDDKPAWFHSDFKDVAYLYTSELYKHMVHEGKLK